MPDLTAISTDLIFDLFPTATGDRLADLVATALHEAESFVEGSPVYVTATGIRQHVRYRLQEAGCQEGAAEITARVWLFRDLCVAWVYELDTEGLTDLDVDLAIDAAVYEARQQMEEKRWPAREEARARLRWLLKKAIARRRMARWPGGGHIKP